MLTKTKRIIIISVLWFLIILISFKSETNQIKAFIDNGDSKIYNSYTINDDFCESSFIVVLKKEYSVVNSLIETKDDFQNINYNIEQILSGIEIKFVKDLTALPQNDHVLFAEKQNNIDEIKNHLEKVEFRQILHIGIEENNKQNILDVINKIQKLDGVRYVSPNLKLEGTEITTNDPMLYEQWALGNNGINAKQAWEITTGSYNVRVGVLDSGIEFHNDLIDNTELGWDFCTIDPITGTYSRVLRQDIGGHGTSVAGIIGAVGNNGIGISGVSQKVSLVPLQTATDTSGSGSHFLSDIVAAITHVRNLWNTSEKIDIINYSISGFGLNTVVLDAVEGYQGLFVWSAGNDGQNIDSFNNINMFNISNLISVGAFDNSLKRSIWSENKSSNYGNSVDVWAPGGKGTLQTNENCLTTHSTGQNEYRFFNGTSAAAPHITGIAALMLSHNPYLTSAQIKSNIINYSDTVTGFLTPIGQQTIKRANSLEIVSNSSHSHTYKHKWVSLQHHESKCVCGITKTRNHTVSSEWTGIGFAICLDCGGPAEFGVVIQSINKFPNIILNNCVIPTNETYQRFEEQN